MWAEAAFGEAGSALSSYANVHAEAQHMAKQAMHDFQVAEHADQLARGVLVAGTPGPGVFFGDDPQAAMARAVALYREAEAILDTAERALVAALEDARAGAPTDPGWLAQFTAGVGEGLTGMVTGLVDLATLAVRLSPNRLAYDPQGWLTDQDAFWGGVGYAVTHPKETGKDLIDYDTWKQSPARAIGKLAPEALLALATAGSAAVAGRTGATGRLDSLVAARDLAKRNGNLYPDVSEARIADRIRRMGHRPGSPARDVVDSQLRPPYGTPDHWVPTTLQPGQRVALVRDQLIPIDEVPNSARELFESQQLPGYRERGPDGEVLAPQYPGEVQIFEVQSQIDGARATKLANPQFGEGGGTSVALDIRDAVASQKLEHAGTHEFDPDTLQSRYEDPEIRAMDDTLSERSLDPDREGVRAGARAAAEEARDYPIGPAATAAVSALDDAEQPAPSDQPTPQGAR